VPSAHPDDAAAASHLDVLLAAARDADLSERIEFRDSIAAHGDLAMEAMTDWLTDERLAAFAIRVLGVIGQRPDLREAVADVLGAVDRDELPVLVTGDVDRALAVLRPPQQVRARGRGGSVPRPPGTPGVDGRGYWVMRTSPNDRPYIWAEAQRGRLRQGWGWNEEMDLDTTAEVVRRGGELSVEQQLAWRARRMRTSAADGVCLNDIVVAPNLPVWGELSVFRVAGSYEYLLDNPRSSGDRFGHILPVELLMEAVDRRSPMVSDGLRAMLRPQTRLYSITAYGGDVERLLGRALPTVRTTGRREGSPWSEAEYEVLFARFPAIGLHPSETEIAELAEKLGRSFDAADWQWRDGHVYCEGRSASTTSNALKAWLDRTGACRS
jgi:hypothetical protein